MTHSSARLKSRAREASHQPLLFFIFILLLLLFSLTAVNWPSQERGNEKEGTKWPIDDPCLKTKVLSSSRRREGICTWRNRSATKQKSVSQTHFHVSQLGNRGEQSEKAEGKGKKEKEAEGIGQSSSKLAAAIFASGDPSKKEQQQTRGQMRRIAINHSVGAMCRPHPLPNAIGIVSRLLQQEISTLSRINIQNQRKGENPCREVYSKVHHALFTWPPLLLVLFFAVLLKPVAN